MEPLLVFYTFEIESRKATPISVGNMGSTDVPRMVLWRQILRTPVEVWGKLEFSSQVMNWRPWNFERRDLKVTDRLVLSFFFVLLCSYGLHYFAIPFYSKRPKLVKSVVQFLKYCFLQPHKTNGLKLKQVSVLPTSSTFWKLLLLLHKINYKAWSGSWRIWKWLSLETCFRKPFRRFDFFQLSSFQLDWPQV